MIAALAAKPQTHAEEERRAPDILPASL